jgi:MoaA/NifB/PqqE/SkfB family radical SAM enzyme
MALVRAAAHRPPSPLKLNFCLTYWCQYKCKTCNIWQRRPIDELTTAEIVAFVRENPHINWVDLTGGEIFLRRDIDEIFDAILSGWSRLALLHFPTNGFQTDRIVSATERIARRKLTRTIVTVSVDGDEALNDEIRGIKGGFRRQMETFRALRRIPGVEVALGMTLSSYNAGAFEQTFAACARECPGLSVDDVHLNVAQRSSHYYGNGEMDAMQPDSAIARIEMQKYRRLRGAPRSPRQILENAYLKHLDPWGVVYPCITYSRPMGRLRDTNMRLDPIWNGPDVARVQGEIWKGQCPQCWTACEAYQSIIGNGLVLRRTTDSATREKEPATGLAG